MITLVLGGTRSGKSAVAESIATTASGPITYVATGTASDPAMAERIARHQARRSTLGWTTVEAGANLPAVLGAVEGPALVDSLGTWVAGCDDLAPDTAALVEVLAARRERGDGTVVVSEEVGFSVHPPTEIGRQFVDALGELNQAVADVADNVLLVVAGRVLPLRRWDP